MTDENLEINNLNINCLTSKNNNFSLDSDGNLIVNSITTKESSSSFDIDTFYPVGSVYLSVNNVNPSALFGGTWEQITGHYLFAANELGSGGSNTTSSTVLNISQIPSHTHTIPALSGKTNTTGNHRHALYYKNDNTCAGSAKRASYDSSADGSTTKYIADAGNHSHTVTTNQSATGAVGGTKGHTHTFTPPYYKLFVYKRIA